MKVFFLIILSIVMIQVCGWLFNSGHTYQAYILFASYIIGVIYFFWKYFTKENDNTDDINL